MSMTFGVDFPFLEVFANDFARYLTLIPFHSMISLFWALLFFYRGGNGYHFQGSRGGNDTRLHCLGTVEYLGLFYFCWLPSPSIFLLPLVTDCFLCISDSEIGEQRASLPLVCGRFGLVASSTMGCGVVSV